MDAKFGQAAGATRDLIVDIVLQDDGEYDMLQQQSFMRPGRGIERREQVHRLRANGPGVRS